MTLSSAAGCGLSVAKDWRACCGRSRATSVTKATDNMKNLLWLHYRGLEVESSRHIQHTGGGYGKRSLRRDGCR
jgi:hypothetical protein